MAVAWDNLDPQKYEQVIDFQHNIFDLCLVVKKSKSNSQICQSWVISFIYSNILQYNHKSYHFILWGKAQLI